MPCSKNPTGEYGWSGGGGARGGGGAVQPEGCFKCTISVCVYTHTDIYL